MFIPITLWLNIIYSKIWIFFPVSLFLFYLRLVSIQIQIKIVRNYHHVLLIPTRSRALQENENNWIKARRERNVRKKKENKFVLNEFNYFELNIENKNSFLFYFMNLLFLCHILIIINKLKSFAYTREIFSN